MFEIEMINKWNIVNENGLPEDETIVYVILESVQFEGEYQLQYCMYHEEKNEFYINYGGMGLVIDAKSVVAWTEESCLLVKKV